MAEDDRRKFLIYPTKNGQQKYSEMLPTVAAIRRKGWGNLNEEDYHHFVRIMDSIYNNFND